MQKQSLNYLISAEKLFGRPTYLGSPGSTCCDSARLSGDRALIGKITRITANSTETVKQ